MSTPAETPSAEAGTTAVTMAAQSRPDEMVRAAWVDPSSFLNLEQARARDKFLNRMQNTKESKKYAKDTKKATSSADSGDKSNSAAAAPLAPEPVVYPSPSAPTNVAAQVTSPALHDAPPRPHARESGASCTPVLTTEEIVIGSFGHDHAEDSGERGQRTRQRTRRDATTPRGAGVRRRANESQRTARQVLTDSQKWGVYSIPPASYYVVPPECDAAVQAELARLEAAHRAKINELLSGVHRQQGVLDDEDMRAWSHPFATEDSQGSGVAAAGEAGCTTLQAAGAVAAAAADEEDKVPPPLTAHAYEPMRTTAEARRPPADHGRMVEEQRYKLPRCPPYRIPLYDQACFKYIFPNLFDSDFQFMEMFNWVLNLILVIVQIVMVVVNVFFNDPQSYLLPWVKTAATVIFSVEFGVTMALILFLIAVVLHAAVTRNIGTKLAQDVAALVTFIGTFSILRAVGLASPSFAIRRIAPQFLNAISFWDVLVGFGMVLLWLAVCLLAFVALIVKVTQIDFAYSTSITEWSVLQFIQLIGLLMNLARVDDSYYKEISVLLDAVHHHFSTPGEAREANSMEKPCLLARLMRFLRIPNYMYYEYFDAIFNYHMDWARFEDQQEESAMSVGDSSDVGGEGSGGKPNLVSQPASKKKKKKKTYNIAYQGEEDESAAYTFDEIPVRMKWRNMFNYLSFVFEIDTVQLRRYLQMVQSPLPFYRVGRDSFLLSFAESDTVGMDMAVWHSDPIAGRTRRYAKIDPGQFNLCFQCEDRRDVWDPDYKSKMEQVESREAVTFAKVLNKRAPGLATTRAGSAKKTPQGAEHRGPEYEKEEEEPVGGEEMSPRTGVVDSEPIDSTENARIVLDRDLFFNSRPHRKHDKYDEDFTDDPGVKLHRD